MPIKNIDVNVFPDGRMDIENTAIYLGVRRKTLSQMRYFGSGPKYIKPGKIFYFKEDLDDWLMRGGKITTT